MLIAIAIYDDNFLTTSTSLKKTKLAPEGNAFGLFSKSPFLELDGTVSKHTRQLTANLTTAIQSENGEFHYLKWLKDENIVMAFTSKRKLEKTEVAHLFNNIHHVHVRGEKLNVSLADILANPLGYTGKDLLTGKIQLALEEVKVEVLKTVEKLTERGEELARLEENTIKLKDTAEDFKEASQKLNKKCCGMF